MSDDEKMNPENNANQDRFDSKSEQPEVGNPEQSNTPHDYQPARQEASNSEAPANEYQGYSAPSVESFRQAEPPVYTPSPQQPYYPVYGSQGYAQNGYQDPYAAHRQPQSLPGSGSSFQQPKARKSRLLPLVVGFSIVSALVGGGVGGSIVAAGQDNNGSNVTISSDGDGTITTTADQSVSNLSAVVAKGLKSVVTVSAVAGETGGTGSGVVLNVDDGYIVTNAHVATLDGASGNATLTVQTSTGDTYSADLVGYDATADLAVLKVDKKMAGVSAIKFASSDAVQVGAGTIAIGSPLGLSGTVTTGIVSALDRPITVSSSDVGNSATKESGIALSVIQTDAAINPGNSGGALLDNNGNLIGLNVAIASASEDSGSVGVGFAIPSDYVKRISSELIADGSGSHGFLGVNLADYSESESAFTSGARITSVGPSSAAGEAGLRAGDVITKVDDSVVASSLQLASIVKQDAPGTKVTVTYTRGGEENTADVILSDS